MPKGGSLHNHLSGSITVGRCAQLIKKYQLYGYYERDANGKKTSPLLFAPDDGNGNVGRRHPREYENPHGEAYRELETVMHCTDSRMSAAEIRLQFNGKAFTTLETILTHVPLWEQHCIFLDIIEHDNVQYAETMQEYSIPPPDSLKAAMDAFNGKFSEAVLRLNDEKLKAYVNEECSALVDAMWSHLQRFPEEIQKIVKLYEECDVKCGEHLAAKRNAKRANLDIPKPSKPPVHVSSPDSPVTLGCIREIPRVEDNALFLWKSVCSHYLIDHTTLVRSLSPVGPETDPTGAENFRVQMLMLNYLKERFNHPHLTVHTAEYPKGDTQSKGARTRIKDTYRLAEPDRMSHVRSLDISSDSPAVLCREIRKRDIALEIALVSNEKLMNQEIDSHPLWEFCGASLSIILVADDLALFDTDVSKQFIAFFKHESSFVQMLGFIRNSLHYSYLREGKCPSIYQRLDSEGILTVREEFLPLIYEKQADLHAKFQELGIEDSPKAQKMVHVERKLTKFMRKLVKENEDSIRTEAEKVIIESCEKTLKKVINLDFKKFFYQDCDGHYPRFKRSILEWTREHPVIQVFLNDLEHQNLILHEIYELQSLGVNVNSIRQGF